MTGWYKDAIFYELYVRAFRDSNGDGHGDLRGVIEKLDYIKELGVDCIWLLPIYPSPLRDDGYDVSDYTDIIPVYGTLDDFTALAEDVHARGMRLILDLVLNHTSDQHPWFVEARSSRNSPLRDYYIWSDTDQPLKDTRIIFSDVESSNWAYDEGSGQYYWHRFYSSQPDLNYDNPAVQEEMLAVMRFWLERGADGFRLDAVPYLIEREGTTGESLPETHAFLKKLRRLAEEEYPDAVLLCEANQKPDQLIEYFGSGDEMHMAFHFPLMPRLFQALKLEEAGPIYRALQESPPLPEGGQWCVFLRNHDELTLEVVSEVERQWMWEQYAPDPAMRINSGIRRRLAPLLDGNPRRLVLANAILLTLPGTPFVFYGDEIGMGDDLNMSDRNGLRMPMQWDDGLNAGFSEAEPARLYAPVIAQGLCDYRRVNVAAQAGDPDSLLNAIKRMVAVRKQQPAFGHGQSRLVSMDDPALLALAYEYEDQRIIVVHNLAASERTVSLDANGATRLVDILNGHEESAAGQAQLKLTLPALGSSWLRLEFEGPSLSSISSA